MWWKFLTWLSDNFPWVYQKVFRPLRRKWFKFIYVNPAQADMLLGLDPATDSAPDGKTRGTSDTSRSSDTKEEK